LKFILTIDTEGDNQWDHGHILTVENIKFIPRFQHLCNKYRIKPTYLVTSEVCDNPITSDILRDFLLSESAEIGTHLHSWTTPPFLEREGYRYNDRYHVYANELPEDILNEKIKYLTLQIETVFGIKPLSFRSGRYGFNRNVAKVLSDNGYLVDSSVTPLIDWSSNPGLPDGQGGPDFIDSSPYPYRYVFEDRSILEFPITILATRFPLNRYEDLSGYYFRNVNSRLGLKILRKFLFRKQPLWLRPHPDMNIDLFKEIIMEAKRIKLPYLVMMFHSSELMPGCSIYRKTNESIEELYNLLEEFFDLLRVEDIAPQTLTEAAKTFEL